MALGLLGLVHQEGLSGYKKACAVPADNLNAGLPSSVAKVGAGASPGYLQSPGMPILA